MHLQIDLVHGFKYTRTYPCLPAAHSCTWSADPSCLIIKRLLQSWKPQTQPSDIPDRYASNYLHVSPARGSRPSSLAHDVICTRGADVRVDRVAVCQARVGSGFHANYAVFFDGKGIYS